MRSHRHVALARLSLVAAVAVVLMIAVAVPAAPAATTPTVVSISVVDGRPVGGIRRTTVKQGTVVRYIIRTARGTDVHLHGYNLERVIRKGRPTVLQLTAKLAGRFELELHHPDAVLAQLTVRP